ncbi:DNA repair-scaffolding protein isoform X2 [Triplophysa rosa]|uniref:DNA repair-scaffolding protein isoform X2 n=1 Tax=Triplophysa rosa TaxID=992332 RepID=UPI0025462CF5|nr:DNA repair-scaffolding protein isoform X2 [Triplophysa rosa]
MSKRKRNLGMRCVLFPDDVKDAFRKSRKEPNKTSTKSWERCGDSFLDTSVVQNLQTSEKTSRGVRKVVQTHVTGVREASTDEPVHIAWSSSEDEESDTEDPPRQTPQTSRAHKQHPVDYYRSLRMLSAGVDADDLPSIDSDSEVEEDNSTSKDQTDFLNPVASPADISVYSSNDDEDPEENRTDSSLLDPADTSRQSVSEWVRSAQAILQTPQKQTTKTIKTPEDSSKKNRKFERGGLAEKLNRLHSRQRSAISFWRHQCNSSTSAADRPGVLTLRILGVREECGMQVAVCVRLPENEKCVALFSKDTAAQLQPTPGDIVHIYPPWQNLVVEGELYPVILNTHFSQKVCVETENAACLRSGVSVEKCRPPQLTRCLWRSETSRGSSEKSVPCEQVSESSCSDRRCVRDSLLDAVEDCGSSGSQGGPVEVVVQRVYCIPIGRSESVSLQHRTPGRPPSRPEPSDHVGRLCAVVQDGYGMFADVLLQCVSTDAEIQQSSEQLEGRVCVLQGLRVIQRLTRDRCSSLFSLIDSLWPPLAAPKSHEDLLQSPSGKVPTPSFCYRLSVQQGHMVPLSGHHVSPLYRPPVLQTLREITQGWNAGEMLLFVTDLSLQTEPNAESVRKSVSVCVSPSCLIRSWVSQALDDSPGRPVLRFRDAVMEQGQIFCVEQTVMELEPDEPAFSVPRPVILDQLTPETPALSLCTLTGVIVEVDESTAFSWPACSRCGSCRLETAQGEGFQCLMCGAMMDEPNTKMRLDVFVCCPSMGHCTVKVKLQQKTITSLLNSTQSPEGYAVESVLGAEIGPLSALVQVVNRSHAVWMVLEEFDLH